MGKKKGDRRRVSLVNDSMHGIEFKLEYTQVILYATLRITLLYSAT